MMSDEERNKLGDEFELTEMLDEQGEIDDRVSIKSTDAVLETHKESLNDLNGASKPELTEQELNPDLANFMSACQEGSLTRVEELISSGKVHASDTFSDGITGLHWASINNRITIVKYLNENEFSKADLNAMGGDLKATPLHWACRNGLVYIVDYLMSEANADPRLRDAQQYNCLHLAIHSSNITLVIYMLLACCSPNSRIKIYIDEPDGHNRTSLHWAAYQGDVFSVNVLLKFGADVSKVDDTLFLPIHWAFMRGYKSVLKALVEAGSDVNAKNDQGKTTFDVAQDMNCSKVWLEVLRDCRRDPKNNWAYKAPMIDPKLAKVITFFTPYIILPITLSIIKAGSYMFIPRLFAGLAIFCLSVLLLSKFVIPIYLVDVRALPKSPMLAGIFSGTAFWAIMLWLYAIVPKLFFRELLANIVLLGLIVIFSWTFVKTLFINPGYVPTPSDTGVILERVKDSIKLGQYDTDHFCVNTLNRKPLRSKFSGVSKKLVARCDHYCPWVYNDIGVRNHKLFVTFVYSLNAAIILFTYLSIKLFDILEDSTDSDGENESCFLLDDELCYASQNHNFHFNLMFWCLLQYTWILLLTIVQTSQILKGVTSREFAALGRMNTYQNNHSTVPADFYGATPPPVRQNMVISDFGSCCRLLGIDQFILTIKLSIASAFTRGSESATQYESLNIPTDFGMKQNWLDFWILGDQKLRNVLLLPIKGENNLNGKVVDYYSLYEYPSKAPENVV